MKTVAYTCPFVPAEWIAAHGFAARRMLLTHRGHASLPGVIQGFCPFAQALVSAVLAPGGSDPLKRDALVMTTACDQMRRAAELVGRRGAVPLFLMNVPATWETPAAQRLYRSEVERLGRFLVSMGGRAPSREELVERMLEIDGARERLRAARGLLSPRDFAEALVRFHGEGALPELPPGPVSHGRGIPLALVGGPLLAHQFELFRIVEDQGGRVALDATTTGERSLPAAFNRREIRRDPVGELTRAYFGSIPDAFQRPNTGLYRWLEPLLAEREIMGILYVRHTWCDTWHAEARRMKEWAGLPFLEIDSGGEARMDGRTLSRLQSFLEILK